MSATDCPSEMTTFFSNMKVVVYEPNSSIKMAIRTVMGELGISTREFVAASTLHELELAIRTNAPNLVFTIDEFETLSIASLVRLHNEVRPSRLAAAFVVLSNYNSAVSASEVGEYGVDLILAKPFTPLQLREKLIEFFSTRVNPLPDLLAIESARELINLRDYKKAETKLVELVAKKQTAVGLYLLAESYRLQEKKAEALPFYTKALLCDQIHFMSLNRSFDLYFEAKDYSNALSMARRLLKNYPINPRKIEVYIRLAVVTHSYSDLIKYCDLADSLRSDQNVIRGLAAGLAVGARYILGQDGELRDQKLALMCLFHAGKLGADFPKILQSVIKSYLEINQLKLADEILQRLILSGHKDDLQTRELVMQLYYRQTDYTKALLAALNLIKDKHYDELVFRISIKSAVRIDRNPEFIRELYQDGVRRFPSLVDLSPLVDSL